MKVMGGSGSTREMKRLNDSSLHRDNAILILQHAIDDQKGIVYDGGVIFFKELRRDDDVGNPCFIFHAQEYKSFGGARPLANNNCTRDANQSSIPQGSQACS